MLVKDNYAANLYINMASSVVNRLIFHNPIYANAQMPEIKLDLASRASADLSDISESKKKEFFKIGYLLEKEPREHYRIINRDIYRTLISQEMLNSNKSTIKINNFYVQSIN